MRSVLWGMLLAMALSGCSNGLGPGTIDGTWVSPFTVPGNSWSMNLSASGSTVTGTGSACGEAAACATITVQGTVDGARVHLDFVASDFAICGANAMRTSSLFSTEFMPSDRTATG